jgi:hypothetical protein
MCTHTGSIRLILSAAFLCALAAPLHAQSVTPAAGAISLPITLSGEIRSRTELDAPGGALASDYFTMLRSRFGIRVDPSAGISLVLQVQDSRVLGTEGNAASAAVDVFDLHQGYLQLATPWRGADLALRAGRQEIALGNERLVGAVNWSNTGRTFDGARVSYAPKGAGGSDRWSATAFAAIMEENGRRFGGTAAGTTAPPDHFVAGAYASVGAPQKPGADLTLLHDGGGRYRTFADADRTTLDARLRAAPLGVRIDLEAAAQTGSQSFVPASGARTSQSVRAWLLGARMAHPVGRGSVTVGIDALSGDDTPADGRYTAFSTMFGTNHPFYGLMDLIGDPAATTKEHGLRDLLGTASYAVSSSFTPRAELHRFTLATGDERALGTEADVVAPIKLPAGTAVELGYSVFRNGAAAVPLGIGADGAWRRWFYVQLRAGF